MKKIGKFFGLTVPLFAAIGIELVITVYVLVTYYAVYFIVNIFQSLVLSNTPVDLNNLLADLPYPGAVLEYMLYIMQIMWAVIFYFWYRKVKTDIVGQKLKLRNVKNIILIFVLGIGVNLATSGLVSLILPHFEKLMEQYNELMESLFTGSPFLIFVSTVILAPVSEELLFRGVILQKSLKFAPFAVANLLQALLFGIFHMNIVQGLYAAAGGLVMGYVAYKFRTIKASMLLHAVYNGLGYLLITPDQEWWFYIYVSAGLLLAAVSLAFLSKARPVVPEVQSGTAFSAGTDRDAGETTES